MRVYFPKCVNDKVEQLWDWSHWDYNEDITYFADKAYYSYTHPY